MRAEKVNLQSLAKTACISYYNNQQITTIIFPKHVSPSSNSYVHTATSKDILHAMHKITLSASWQQLLQLSATCTRMHPLVIGQRGKLQQNFFQCMKNLNTTYTCCIKTTYLTDSRLIVSWNSDILNTLWMARAAITCLSVSRTKFSPEIAQVSMLTMNSISKKFSLIRVIFIKQFNCNKNVWR